MEGPAGRSTRCTGLCAPDLAQHRLHRRGVGIEGVVSGGEGVDLNTAVSTTREHWPQAGTSLQRALVRDTGHDVRDQAKGVKAFLIRIRHH